MLDEVERFKVQNGDHENEAIRLQELLERMQQDKAKLSRRVSKLVFNGKN